MVFHISVSVHQMWGRAMISQVTEKVMCCSKPRWVRVEYVFSINQACCYQLHIVFKFGDNGRWCMWALWMNYSNSLLVRPGFIGSVIKISSCFFHVVVHICRRIWWIWCIRPIVHVLGPCPCPYPHCPQVQSDPKKPTYCRDGWGGNLYHMS